MITKRRLAALATLSLALPLFLVTWAMAAPNLVGTWKGTAPVISTAGCSNESITLIISAQCTNLFSGTIQEGDRSVPVVGRLYNDNTLTIMGELINYTPTTLDIISLSGVYVASNPTSITVNTFSHTTENIEDMNKEYDTFSLIKQ
jgi:hypothetical protein